MSKDTKKQVEPVEENVDQGVQEAEKPALKTYLFPEREVSIVAESLEEATKIYNSRFNPTA